MSHLAGHHIWQVITSDGSSHLTGYPIWQVIESGIWQVITSDRSYLPAAACQVCPSGLLVGDGTAWDTNLEEGHCWRDYLHVITLSWIITPPMHTLAALPRIQYSISINPAHILKLCLRFWHCHINVCLWPVFILISTYTIHPSSPSPSAFF